MKNRSESGSSEILENEIPQQVVIFDGVSKSFSSSQGNVQAVSFVSASISRGKVTGIIGPDGAGKTTLIRMAAGLLFPDTGTITVFGMETSRDALAIQTHIGYMPQQFGLYEDLTVQENLDLYADLQGVPDSLRAERYDELMRMTGLSPFKGRLAKRLSGGMKQKLGLACTLVHTPDLLLLDEPTVGVDPVSRRELWQIVQRFVKQAGTTVLLSTAYLDEAERCDNVIILDAGQLLRHGPPSDFSKPLAGRTFQAQVPHYRNRDLQEMLSQQSDVIDAVIQRDSVRLVLGPDAASKIETLLPDAENARITSVPPRFEDGFIALLREHRAAQDSNSARPAYNPGPQPGTKHSRGNGNAIEVRDVQRRFGNFYAVKHVSFDVNRGEVFGLLGANGAGKTTMFRMLCGLLPVSGGTLQVAGVDVRKTAAAARARIGYMSQHFSMYGTLSVSDNMNFFSSAYGLTGQKRRDRINWAVQEFELGPVYNSTSGLLPLGYKQRLALACSLMHEPDILFLDEPTSGVDPLVRREFWHRINDLANQGVTILVTTHFMEEAEYCDRLAIMITGEILALGTPLEIRRSAETEQVPEPTMEDAFISIIDSNKEIK